LPESQLHIRYFTDQSSPEDIEKYQSDIDFIIRVVEIPASLNHTVSEKSSNEAEIILN
jgi:hypothetical protein